MGRPAACPRGRAPSSSRVPPHASTPGASAATARAPSLLLHSARLGRRAASRGSPRRDCPPPLSSWDRRGARGRGRLALAGPRPLPAGSPAAPPAPAGRWDGTGPVCWVAAGRGLRSEEHTSELQSLRHLVCRLLLEKKKKI